MTHKILKSSLLPYPGSLDDARNGLSSLVERFLAELRTWHDHDLKAKALVDTTLRAKPEWRDFHKAPVLTHDMTDAQKNAALIKANTTATEKWMKATAAWQQEMLARHEPYPRPTVHPDIEASVKTVINADGSITYEPDYEIENDDPTPDQVLASKKSALIHKITVAENAALDLSQLPVGKRRAANLKENDIVSADGEIRKDIAKGLSPADALKVDFDAEVVKRRDPKDTQHLADQKARRDAVDAIMRKGAQAMSDVEDLTLDNIDNYQAPDFG
jgi:hypothetical protein